MKRIAWNKGLKMTMRDDSYMHTQIFKDKVGAGVRKSIQDGRINWNKNLTKETDRRVKQTSEKISQTKQFQKQNGTLNTSVCGWNKGLKMTMRDDSYMKTKEFKDKVSAGVKKTFQNGRIHWNKGKKGLHTSWCKGLTKKVNPSLQQISKKLKGRTFSAKSLERMSAAHKGCKSWNKGLTKEINPILKRISDNSKGPNNHMFGKSNKDHLSLDARKRISNYMKNGGAIKARLANCCPSRPQKEMYLTILDYFSDAVLEFPIKTNKGIKLIDVAVPSKKLAFEFNGKYWHQDKEKDKIREDAITAEGWVMIIFNEDTICDLITTLEQVKS